MKAIEKGMSANQINDILQDKLEEAIKHKSYTQVWEIYGEAYMAFRLGAIRRFQYDKLWSKAYPILVNIELVPKNEGDTSMNDKDILKILALQLLIYAAEVVGVTFLFLGGLWLFGLIAELVIKYVPLPITLIVGVAVIVLMLSLPYIGRPPKRVIMGYRSTMERR